MLKKPKLAYGIKVPNPISEEEYQKAKEEGTQIIEEWSKKIKGMETLTPEDLKIIIK